MNTRELRRRQESLERLYQAIRTLLWAVEDLEVIHTGRETDHTRDMAAGNIRWSERWLTLTEEVLP